MIILIDLPEGDRRPLGLDLICPELGYCNLTALTSDADAESSETQGTLSIKTSFGGREHYRIGNDRFTVGPTSYLLVNHAQRYSGYVESKTPVESLSVFFRPGFAEQGLRSLITPEDHLLADPVGAPEATPIQFVEKVYHNDPHLMPAMQRLHEVVASRQTTRAWLHEQYYDLLLRMLTVHRDVGRQMNALPAIKRSTRVETYRRLCRAVDFMEANLRRVIGLRTIASEATLAPHHFLRLFKRAFGRTPHQYLTARRIEEASALLRSTDMAIADVCYALGFDSVPSFSLLFKRHTGLAPGEFRRSSRRTGKSAPAIGNSR